MMEPLQPNSLQYAEKPTAAHRWRWRVVFGVLAVTIALLAWTRGPAVWDRAMLLYWQRQCLNYTAPADQVVYEMGRDDSGPAIWHVPKAAQPFLARGRLPALQPGEGVLFLHELTSPGGTRRLVMVTGWSLRAPFITVRMIEPFGWRLGGSTSVHEPDPSQLAPVGPLDIYAGQVDPSDPSHFTVRFQRTATGMIEGRLTDDGSVHLQFLGSKADGFDTPLEKP